MKFSKANENSVDTMLLVVARGTDLGSSDRERLLSLKGNRALRAGPHTHTSLYVSTSWEKALHSSNKQNGKRSPPGRKGTTEALENTQRDTHDPLNLPSCHLLLPLPRPKGPKNPQQRNTFQNRKLTYNAGERELI